ncbi:glycine betaine/L-proline ABC transporter substrate-binding protein ProX [Desulfovibrio inopinatus]|uniref:glycine betaine/L-proline ABC transporter substrate-binding protein ProX n=1 Tax=Desulfovibrio inopinatus TaxID=102109 RepID=UPI0003FFAF1C|nr:glycine betaine/L-proline ABC transporter substrate-binding protein ProX [Desulfovibrio inopinatus]
MNISLRAGRKLACMLLMLCLASSALAADELPGNGKEVQPASPSWSTGLFQDALYNRALEELGYTVKKPKELSNSSFYQAISRGDVDFWVNGWFPLHNALVPRDFREKAEVLGHVVQGGGIAGYLVSRKAADKFGIHSLEDFKRPDVKAAFDINGDGKADLVACPHGWACEKIIAHHLDTLDLNDDINAMTTSYTANMANTVSRAHSGQPVFFYTWTPNWTIAKLKPGKDVVWINVPQTSPETSQKELEDKLVVQHLPGAVTDPINLGFIANDIQVVANKQFLSENPAARALFEVMTIPLADVAAQNAKMFEGESSPEDIDRHVNTWIARNKKKWDSWIHAAKKAAAATH